MINSLCPRPIGTKLSTALIPVCMGSLTEIRGMIPGAFNPTRARVLDLKAPYEQKNIPEMKWVCKYSHIFPVSKQ